VRSEEREVELDVLSNSTTDTSVGVDFLPAVPEKEQRTSSPFLIGLNTLFARRVNGFNRRRARFREGHFTLLEVSV